MTWRARAYLAIMGIRHLAIGLFALFAPRQFQGKTFAVIEDVLPLQVWGVIFLFIGLHAGAALFLQHEWWARLTICASAMFTAMWAAGFLGAAQNGELFAPIAPIIWGSLTAKDLVVAAMPLRSPFERLIEQQGG